MTFISVIRLLPMWFSGRILPQISQWTGNLGQIGQIAVGVPVRAAAAQRAGWTPAFGVAAAASAVGLVLAFVFVRNGPVPVRTDTIPLPHTGRRRLPHLRARAPPPRHAARLLVALRHAVLGHGVLPAVGRPDAPRARLLLDRGGGVPHRHRRVGFVAGPLLGVLCARFPLRRSNLVLGVVVLLGVRLDVRSCSGPATRRPGCSCCSSSRWASAVPVRSSGSTSPARSTRWAPWGRRTASSTSAGFLAAFVMMSCIGAAPRRGRPGHGRDRLRLGELPGRAHRAVRRGRVRRRRCSCTPGVGPARMMHPQDGIRVGTALGCTRCTPAEADRAIMNTDPFGPPSCRCSSRAPVSSGDLTWVLVLPGTGGVARTRTSDAGELRRGPWAAREGHDPTNVARRER